MPIGQEIKDLQENCGGWVTKMEKIIGFLSFLFFFFSFFFFLFFFNSPDFPLIFFIREGG